MSLFDRTERIIIRLAAAMAIIGGAGLIFATVVTCLSILGRVFRRSLDWAFATTSTTEPPWAMIRPILGEEELVALAVGFALYCALPWVTIQRGHIRVDLLSPFFGRRLNQLLDLLADVMLALVAYLLVTRQLFLIFSRPRRGQDPLLHELIDGNWPILAERLRDNQESQVLGIALWPTYIVAEVCAVLFLAAALVCVWRSARILLGAGGGWQSEPRND